MLLINNETVEKILDMKGCLEALEIGYRDLSEERAVYRPRIDVFAPNDDHGLMFRWGAMERAGPAKVKKLFLSTMAPRACSLLPWQDTCSGRQGS